MKGLIIKDFINLKKNAKVFAGISVIYAVMAIMSGDTGFFSSIMTVLIAILTLSLYSYDDLAKWDTYALTMPVSRDHIVQGKYLMMLALTLIGMSYGTIFSVALNIYFKEASIFHGFVNIGAGGAIVIFFYSIVIPFVTKLGVEKARIIFLAVYMIPFLTVLFVKKLSDNGSLVIPEEMLRLFRSIVKYEFVIIPFIVLAALGISYRISIGIYRKKEF